MSKEILTQSNPLKLDFSIDFAFFTQSIKSNFTIIYDLINKQSQQIEMLKTQLLVRQQTHQYEDNSRKNSRASNRNINQNGSLNYSGLSHEEAADLGHDSINNKNETKFIANQDSQVQKITQIALNSQAKDVKQNNKDEQIKQVKRSEQNLIGNLSKNLMSQQSPIAKPKKLSTNKQSNSVKILPTQVMAKQSVSAKVQQQNDDAQPKAQIKSNNNDNNQNDYSNNNNDDKQNGSFMSLIENKILEMNERLERMQLAAVKENSTFSKKMNQIYNQLDKNADIVTKKENQIKKLEFIVEKFRSELSEYKLKKQAQLMKISMGGAANNGNSSSNQFNQLIMQKIQQISNYLPQLLLKADFQDYKAEIKLALAKLERKTNDAVGSEQFNNLVGVLSRKKPVTSKIVSNKTGKIHTKQSNQQVELEQADVDPFVQLKIAALQSSIKQIKQQMLNESQINNQKHEKAANRHKQASDRIQQAFSQILRSQTKSGEYEQFMRNMNESYNEKIKQIVNQITQTQESVQKLSNQMKFYSYTNKSDTNVGAAGPTSFSSGQIQGGKIIDLQNEMNASKKKVNKITLKMQSMKEDLLTVRQDFAKEIDIIKVTLQKKCDWQSLKKGMHYFEERVKQISIYVEQMQKNLVQSQQNNQSTAAKKGWTCLCCDKDIKQYEGKLGEIKFTSIFPTRYQSPRIGGYYRQKQSSKEYNQVFLKHNRRLSQNHQNQTKSKQEIL